MKCPVPATAVRLAGDIFFFCAVALLLITTDVRFGLDLARRALAALLSMMGTTLPSVVVTFLVVPALATGWKAWKNRKRGVRNVMSKEDWKGSAIIIAVVWSVMYGYNVAWKVPHQIYSESEKRLPPLVLPPLPAPDLSKSGQIVPTRTVVVQGQPIKPISASEIAQFASGAVLAVQHGDEPPSGTAFWIHPKGHVATCADAAFSPREGNLTVSYSMPVFANVHMESYGATTLNAIRQGNDGSGTVVLGVMLSQMAAPNRKPSQRFHTEETNKGIAQFVVGETWIIPLQVELPKEGDRVFVYALEPNGQFPSYTIMEGSVVRVAGGKGGLRAYTTFPFKPTYCGAPVINESKQAVGMASGNVVDGQTEIIPSLYIAKLMDKIGLH